MSSSFNWQPRPDEPIVAGDPIPESNISDSVTNDRYRYYGSASSPATVQPRQRGGLRGMVGALLGLLLLVGSKLKGLLVLLKFTKIGATTLSMLLSVIVYGALFGWAYGLGIVLLLFVHEMGHVLAARYEGVRVSAPMFIPFMGAFISMRQRPNDSLAEAKIAAGGPVLGSLGALACLGMYSLVHQPILLALASTGFFLNLFNLVPMSPLDGGRILGASSKWALVVGLPILAFFAFRGLNPILWFILLLGAFDLWQRFQAGDSAYYRISPAARWGIAGFYVLLTAAVAWGMADSQSILQAMRTGGAL